MSGRKNSQNYNATTSEWETETEVEVEAGDSDGGGDSVDGISYCQSSPYVQDVRKAFVAQTAGGYFGLEDHETHLFYDRNELINFLDDPNVKVLSIKKIVGEGLVLESRVNFEDHDEIALVFCKTLPLAVTPENMYTNINICTIVENPVSSLLQSMAEVFIPSISKNQKWRNRIEEQAFGVLVGLEETIGAQERGKKGIQAKTLNGIITVHDEEMVWLATIQSVSNQKDASNVTSIYELIREMNSELKEYCTVEAGTDAFDSLLQNIQKLLTFSEKYYPDHRLIHLLDIIGTQLTYQIKDGLKGFNVWSVGYNEAEKYLNWGLGLCKGMLDMCELLTGQLLPNSRRKYQDGIHLPSSILQYKKRLEEIMKIRNLHKELSSLLTVAECEILHPKKCFAAFNGINPINYNSYTDSFWHEAIERFEKMISPADDQIAAKLTTKLSVTVNPIQLLAEFQRYRSLIERPKIAFELRPNRENFLNHLLQMVNSYQNFAVDKIEDTIMDDVMSPHVKQIYTARQISQRGKEVGDLAGLILSDLPEFPKLGESVEKTLRKVKDVEDNAYRLWLDETQQAISMENMTIRMDKKVVDFNSVTGHMEVNYSHKLKNLIEDAGQLVTLGFRLPQNISSLVTLAKRYLRQGKQLDNIASFHNTISQRIIGPTKPMLIDTAAEFTKLVQEQHNIKWTDGAQIENYIDKLMQVVRRFNYQNNELSRLHLQITQKISRLKEQDIMTNIQHWRSIVNEVEELISRAESAGFKNTSGWRQHFNKEISKAVEKEYVKGLENVISKLPRLSVEVMFRGNELQFKPNLEELRAKNVAIIKRFVTMPERFIGVDNDPNNRTFANLCQKQSHKFNQLYKEAEMQFVVVRSVVGKYHEWLSSGLVDPEFVIIECSRTATDWEKNLRVAKSIGQKIARTSFEDSVIGCVKVSYASLQKDLEALNRRYFEYLISTLRNNIKSEGQELKVFLESAIEKLQTNPQTVEEITKGNLLKEELAEQLPYFKKLKQGLDEKNEILMNWAKDRIDFNKMIGLWENFNSMLENYGVILKHQIQTVKALLNSRAVELNDELDNFRLHWEEFKPKEQNIESQRANVAAMVAVMASKEKEWKALAIKRQNLSNSCSDLGVETKDIKEIQEVDAIEKEIVEHQKIWSQMKSFDSELAEFKEEDWIVFRSKPHRFEEFIQKWEKSFFTAANSSATRSPLTNYVAKELDSYKSIVPNIKLLRGDTFGDKHWYELFQVLNMEPKAVGLLKFGDFLDVRQFIVAKIKDIKDLNARATGEVTVRQALTELDVWEIEAMFTLLENTDSHGQPVFIIEDFKNILNKVGDNQSLLQSIKTSSFFGNFADRITVWENRLIELDVNLVNLNKIQRRWVYLEPIFNHGVMGTEQRRFLQIDEEYRNIMQIISKEKRVSSLLKIPNLKNRLSSLVDQLARCQSTLNEFLEKKRSSFPRFYFIGDDDLLEIMGQSTKPNVIQAHLKKLFAGIYNVDFDDSFKSIVAMKSLEGEIVPLKNAVKISNNVEEWLSELSTEMKLTLKSLLLECISTSKNSSRSPDAFPSQILLLTNSIIFTEKCEEAIRTGQLNKLLVEIKASLETYTSVVVPGKHSNPLVLELKLKDLILDIIHEIYMIEFLIREKVSSVTEWNWQKQLRFYVNEDGTAAVKMADAEFLYSYEYQGNSQKLVHTPLTDKCYLTLTQGMRAGLGGNPYGPAGTGKTESVKALGGLMGRQVLVFNCDEGIDVKAMGRIFIGLVKCGAWGCFDEFNRLDGATLSAISMQIEPIQSALRNSSKSVKLMEEVVSLDPNAGIFVTMNPAGKGYGGRNKLPDNLKQLFRPVVMSSPNNDLISEVILHTEGFKGAPALGAKLVEVFTLSSKLLSNQKHYDWGLRALKTVLKGCGRALKEFKKERQTVTDKEESDLVVASLRLNTLPKLTYADSLRFDQLVKDVFSNVSFQDLGNESLASNLRKSAEEMYGFINESQIRKCLELHEQLEQRMGVVIVGPSCCGKSTIWKLLRNALLKMNRTIRVHIINPKSMTRAQLLGHINLDTRQWTDGVLTLKAQQVYSEPPEITSWIICDGDIDPEWVESLNSVLDDNRLLTLPSGWRIKFGPNVNFIFETHDLSYASPATVSRMGMILMSDEDAEVKVVVNHWLQHEVEEKDRVCLQQFIEDYFYTGLSWISQQQSDQAVVQLPIISIVKNGLAQLKRVSTIQEFLLGMIRGMSVHLSHELRLDFAKNAFSWTNQPIRFETENLLSLYYDKKTKQIQVFQNQDLIPGANFDLNHPPLVHSANARQVLAQIRPLFESKESFMLIGPEGCGKTLILETAFKDLRNTEVSTIYCSSLISPQHLLQKLTQICITASTTTGRAYKLKNGGSLILYFKDLNLVKPDKWETCNIVEFLLQITNYKGFYDSNLEWVELKDVQIVVSLTLTATRGRYNLSPRFLSNMRLCVIEKPNKSELLSIYQNYYAACLNNNYPDHPLCNPTKIQRLAEATISFYDTIGLTFTEGHQSHYHTTTRDLTKFVCGLMRYNLSSTQGEVAVKNFALIWANEARRLFRDKLVSQDDKKKFDEILDATVANEWSISQISLKMTATYFVSGFALGTLPSDSEVLAANTAQKTSAPSSFKTRLTRLGADDFLQVVESGLAHYAREIHDLEIVLFSEVLENVCRFDQILAAPGASLVLAGLSGVGRRSALSIVSSLHGATVLSLKVGRNYGMKNFKNDLKSLIQTSAIEGNKTFFMVEDFQLIDNAFLDMINGLLSTGEVPGLYTAEELEIALIQIREQAASDGHTGTLHSYLANRIKEFLHVVLLLDYTSPFFKSRCESNPAIYKQCSIIWMNNWNPDTLYEVPNLILSRFYELVPKSEVQLAPETDEAFTHYFRHVYDTLDSSINKSPRRYLGFVHTYATIFIQRRNEIQKKIAKLQAGIEKLTDARNRVEGLKREAATQEVTLAEKQQAANNALEQITATMGNAKVQRVEVEELQERTLKENEILKQKKLSIDEELAQIEPLIQQARASVGNIKNEALTEIRSLRAPPDIIRDILEAVLRLMGVMDTSWNSMKAFLAQRGVKEEIRNFDAQSIKIENRNAVEKLLIQRGDSFDPKNAKRASAVAAPLADWVQANVKYSLVLERIQPLTDQQQLLERNLEKAKNQLSNLNSELLSVDERVEQLKANLNRSTKEGAEIELNLSKAKKTLSSAETLVGKLQEEYSRWTFDNNELNAELALLPIKCLLSAAFISYLSDRTEDTRTKYMNKWKNLFQAPFFEFLPFMSTEKEKLSYQLNGLPAEHLSHENAVVILNKASGKPGVSCMRPFLIDPSGRATEWLRNQLSSEHSSVVMISLRDPKFSTELELAIRFGKCLIIVEVDEIEPILIPILRGDIVSQGSRELIPLADKFLDFNMDFKLFLSTRNPNPLIPPDSSSLVTIINFTTTRTGLTTQLLTTTLSIEKPELQERKSKLLKESESLRIDLANVSEMLLQELANSEGNILENQDLLQSLNASKLKSISIVDSIAESDRVSSALNKEVNVYKPLAEFGSKLFFAITEVHKLNIVYQFSLSSFAHLFTRNLHVESAEDTAAESRMKFLQKKLESSTFDYVCRSLFKVDRLAFALHFVHVMHAEFFKENEWEAFTGQLLTDSRGGSASSRGEPVPNWINEDRTLAVQLLRSSFPKLYEQLELQRSEIWSDFYNTPQCETRLPSAVVNSLTPFQIVMLIQSLRPDRLHTAMNDFVCKALGRRSLFSSPMNLQTLLSYSRESEPILILMSSGVDPSEELKSLADTTGGKENYAEISLGQGQFETALQKLHEASSKGSWLCLKNLHLVTYWLTTLEKEIQGLKPQKNFRLWLTAEPYEEFPTILAESCLKMAYEAPQGVKMNLQRTYSNWSTEYVSGADRNVFRMQALFALAFFHAIVQERRTYIAQGWSKFYEFNESDIRAGMDVIDRMFKVSRTKEIQWAYVQGLFENSIYGGRIDNDFDSRVLVSYLQTYFNANLLAGTKSTPKQICEGITIPATTNPKDYRSVIDSLQDYDKPVYFGLPNNIERSWQISTSSHIIHQLKLLSRTFDADVKFNRELWNTELSPLLNSWKRMNVSHNTTNLLQVKVSTPNVNPNPASGGGDGSLLEPIHAFVKMEYYNSITFIKRVHKSLAGISKVIRNANIVPTGEIISIANSLLKRETPAEWLQEWIGPTEPLLYLQGIVKKIVALQGWLPLVEKGQLLDEPINLADCLHPDSFLCAFKQQCARRLKLSMDELRFVCTWNQSRLTSNRLACKLTGLLLEGCSFNGLKLIENTSESSPIVKIPDTMISWVPKNEIEERRDGEVISIPFYSTEARENLLCSLDFPAHGQGLKWIQAGVAVFLQN